MSKRPVNLTLHERVLQMADEIMRARGYASMSALIEELIRNEYDRRIDSIQQAKEDERITLENVERQERHALNEEKTAYKTNPISSSPHPKPDAGDIESKHAEDILARRKRKQHKPR